MREFDIIMRNDLQAPKGYLEEYEQRFGTVAVLRHVAEITNERTVTVQGWLKMKLYVLFARFWFDQVEVEEV